MIIIMLSLLGAAEEVLECVSGVLVLNGVLKSAKVGIEGEREGGSTRYTQEQSLFALKDTVSVSLKGVCPTARRKSAESSRLGVQPFNVLDVVDHGEE